MIVVDASVLRKRWLAQTLSDQRFEAAIADLQRLDFEWVPTLRLIPHAYQLRADVTACDAAYVALAEALGCELLTPDKRLAGATGPRCAIRVLS